MLPCSAQACSLLVLLCMPVFVLAGFHVCGFFCIALCHCDGLYDGHFLWNTGLGFMACFGSLPHAVLAGPWVKSSNSSSDSQPLWVDGNTLGSPATSDCGSTCILVRHMALGVAFVWAKRHHHQLGGVPFDSTPCKSQHQCFAVHPICY
ncbi:hypothetical protein COO60DRAFT_1538106 [Scenedesmus sp. NREL 46B-D3]|nr:hypothetical protein COO60DRAFT_1538106 [Scenedesmus sp. NREL 46B-D3]